ncbi:MAG TPA: FAD-binding oxidoreductase [Dongiaceae bacterium]|nr:FAD-binding oxidoreductase [Dongiaceae bacterium]
MNKIAVYLNEHLMGEVSSAKALRRKFSTDGSVLSIAPEIVAFPRVTNDIRKIARFTWQLAEKGHVVPLTARGYGGDTTGAAIGKGVVIDLSQHLNSVIEVVAKDKLVHVQPGASLKTVNEALRWQGMKLYGATDYALKPVSVGGAIASDSFGADGTVAGSVERLEVILANGDIIETGKISKRDVSKKLGLQTFEGEIYRKLEGLLEDNEALIKQLAQDETRDNTGYKRLADIRDKDGSFDLTPLFIGSQGTLGIISEVVLKTDFYSVDDTHVAVMTDSIQTARDLAERINDLEPTELTIYDGALFRRAAHQGAQFSLLGSVDQVGAVLYVRFNDFSPRVQTHKLKKLRRLLAKATIGAIDSTERDPADFKTITGILQTLSLGSSEDHIAIPLLNGASVPANRREEFEIALGELAARDHIELPVVVNCIDGTYDVATLLKLESVSDKQKLFKLLTDYATVVDRCGGAFTADGAEGRLKAPAAWAVLDGAQVDLYHQLRAIFDPFNTLNPGVKDKTELRTLVAALRADFDGASVL